MSGSSAVGVAFACGAAAGGLIWWASDLGGRKRLEGELRECRQRLADRDREGRALQDALAHEETKRQAERTGRIRAEAALRKALESAGPASGADARKGGGGGALAEGAGGGEEERVIPMLEIGRLRSCYRRRFGTPRQGVVVEGGRAMLKMYDAHNPKMSCANLDEFSHVWLIYLFHENTNVGRKMRAGASAVKSKVAPPRLDGAKVGLFSTRTPHRPNAIGLSLVKLDRVENGVVHLSGIDLVNGTPILDIKPYLPYADSSDSARVPSWIEGDAPVGPNTRVTISGEAEEALRDLVLFDKLEFYSSYEEAWAAIAEVLSCDIRSKNMRDGGCEGDPVLCFDNLEVSFVCQGHEAHVSAVRHLKA